MTDFLNQWNEAEMLAAIKFTDPHQPGQVCPDCSQPNNVPWQRQVFHPNNRPHGTLFKESIPT